MWFCMKKHVARATVASMLVCASARADLVPVILNFQDIVVTGVGGDPISEYQGFTFDAGSFVVDSLGNIMLTMLNPLVITRTDGGEFLFHSLQYSARGGDSDEYYFLAHHGATVVFSGAGVNANDPGNFKTDVSQPGLTELSGFATQPITRLTVVSSKTTPTQADYSHVAMDNLQFTVVSEVPEPATFALFGVGLLALSARRARR